MKLLQTESDSWSIEVSIVYSDRQVLWVPRQRTFVSPLSDPFKWRCCRLNLGLSHAKQIFCYWAMPRFLLWGACSLLGGRGCKLAICLMKQGDPMDVTCQHSSGQQEKNLKNKTPSCWHNVTFSKKTKKTPKPYGFIIEFLVFSR